MANTSPSQLTDQELLDATSRVAANERRTAAELVALLAELDLRKLHIGLGYSSLFVYCTNVLRLSESAAYSRITTARLSRRFPTILSMMADGEITLTTITLLAAHLNDENAEALLDAARHKSKREVERLVASLCAQPDIPAVVRRLPVTRACAPEPPATLAFAGDPALSPRDVPNGPPLPGAVPSPAKQNWTAVRSRRDPIAPLSTESYLLRLTIRRDTHAKLEIARNLLRHTLPGADLAVVIDRALTVLVTELRRQKTGAALRPRSSRKGVSRGRHVPAAVRRAVWTRDEGRCAFVGSHGRCSTTAFLEFHHVVPFAAGGPTTADNLELRCRVHNAYEAERYFGFDSGRPIGGPTAR